MSRTGLDEFLNELAKTRPCGKAILICEGFGLRTEPDD